MRRKSPRLVLLVNLVIAGQLLDPATVVEAVQSLALPGRL